MTKRILISTGDVSADVHAANLVNTLKAREPDIEFSGMGGDAMAKAGVDILVDSREMAMIGTLGIFRLLGKIYRAYRRLKRELLDNPPDLMILIDYSGFNLLMAKVAKRAGVRTLYYIGPQIWASRPKRIEKIRRYVDQMAVIFPFEKRLYGNADIPVCFVGHPLANSVKPTLSIEQACQQFSINKQTLTIGLLPGSRRAEIRSLMPVMIRAAEKLHEKYPDAQFVLPLAPNLTPDDLAPYLEKCQLNIALLQHNTYNAVQLCDAVIIASGTATLEVALLGVPMVIIYKVDALTYQIGKRIINIPYIGLCNIVAEKKIVQEFIQHEANADNVFMEISRILDDADYRQKMLNDLQQVRNTLAGQNADKPVAELVLEQMDDISKK